MYIMIIIYTAFNIFGGTTMSGATSTAEFSNRTACVEATKVMEKASDRYRYICVPK